MFILSVVDEMTDGKKWFGWLIRRLYKRSLKGKLNAPRGSRIDGRVLEDMERYLKLSRASAAHWFVCGHTHVPEGRKREDEFSVVNTGSWFRDSRRVHNTYVIIDDEVVIRRLGDSNPYWS